MKDILILFFSISIIGTLLHFTYQFSKKNIVVGIFSAINESVWEHIKIMHTPIYIINIIRIFLGYKNNYFLTLFTELFLSMLLIIIFYQIKIAIFKNKKGYINVISFYIVAIIVSIVGNYIYNMKELYALNTISIFGCLIMFVMYLTFSVFPLKNFIFKDPVTGTYGIKRL